VPDRPQRSGATWSLLLLVAALTALPAVSSVRSALVLTGVLELGPGAAARSRAGLAGVYGEQALRNAEGIAAVLVTGPAAVVGLLVLVGLLTWRTWAREAALGVFGLSGALLCVLSFVGLSEQAPNAALGLVAGVLLLVAAGLAVSPPVCADFDRKRIADEVRERARRTQERQSRTSSG
jgi:hypothetical protein